MVNIHWVVEVLGGLMIKAVYCRGNAYGQKCTAAVDFWMLMAIHANAIVLKGNPSEPAK